MFKQLLFILLPLASVAQTVNGDHELLWEISGNGLESSSYLFGSFHSNDKRLFNLSDSTFLALDQAEMIVLETDIFSLFDEWDTRVSSVQMKYDNEGQPYVSDSEASVTHYGDEDGMPQFLDAFFEQYCFNADKKFFPLESVDFQLNLFSDMEFPDFRRVRFESFLLDQDDMLNMYLKGDIYNWMICYGLRLQSTLRGMTC